jgi:TPR repeat protein
MDAHYNLSYIYNEGRGVEKDSKKELYHLEEASIGGHPSARYNLGYYEGKKGGLGGGRNEMHDRAAKHYIIAARLGHDEALNKVKQGFVAGLVSKEDYASTLRGHQAAVDATKSTHREEADAFYKKIEARLNNEN